MSNQSNMPPLPPLDKCADCQMPFSSGQEHWTLKNQGQSVMNHCLACSSNYSYEKKKWEVAEGVSTNEMSDKPNFPIPPLDKCSECKLPFETEQNFWALNYKGTRAGNCCVDCWNNFSHEKVKWGK